MVVEGVTRAKSAVAQALLPRLGSAPWRALRPMIAGRPCWRYAARAPVERAGVLAGGLRQPRSRRFELVAFLTLGDVETVLRLRLRLLIWRSKTDQAVARVRISPFGANLSLRQGSARLAALNASSRRTGAPPVTFDWTAASPPRAPSALFCRRVTKTGPGDRSDGLVR